MWFKRIGLFLLTNILIMVTISFVTNLLGVGHYLDAYGINYTSLMVFSFMWGMGGAFISLAMSKMMAKWSMGVKIIDPSSARGIEQDLLTSVRRLCQRAGLPMPEVGIFESPEANAFATGPSKSSALVAVSTGLLNRMDFNAVEGVLGHELAHVANGDMVTMTLIQGVVNSFALFFSRIISFAISQTVKEEMANMVRFILTIVLDIAFSVLGSIVVAYFSRMREFRADAGGATLAGKANMISALQALQREFGKVKDDRGAELATLKISNSGMMALFSTHPPLEERIKVLQSGIH